MGNKFPASENNINVNVHVSCIRPTIVSNCLALFNNKIAKK
jgi:hypothetical protein